MCWYILSILFLIDLNEQHADHLHARLKRGSFHNADLIKIKILTVYKLVLKCQLYKLIFTIAKLFCALVQCIYLHFS